MVAVDVQDVNGRAHRAFGGGPVAGAEHQATGEVVPVPHVAAAGAQVAPDRYLNLAAHSASEWLSHARVTFVMLLDKTAHLRCTWGCIMGILLLK